MNTRILVLIKKIDVTGILWIFLVKVSAVEIYQQ